MKSMRVLLLAIVALLCLVGQVMAQATASWPQWRGPNRDGISKETGLLKQWPADGPPLVWKATGAGGGYSSFSISNGKLYTMGLRGDREFVIAFDVATGKEAWATAARFGISQRSRRRPARDADSRWRSCLCTRRQRRSYRLSTRVPARSFGPRTF